MHSGDFVRSCSMVISELLPKPALWAIGAEREGCLCHAHRDSAGGGLLGEGVDTGKSHVWSVFSFFPLCPVVWFGI